MVFKVECAMTLVETGVDVAPCGDYVRSRRVREE
jgi:hypothetical protein